MFSRTGKFTISMYMVFNQKKRSLDQTVQQHENIDDEDIGLLLGKKGSSVQDEM